MGEEVRVIDPRELNDLADFAARGGLGQAVATEDCVAESPDQLMYIAGDTLVLLREMGEIVLASCEGVVGWVKKGEVNFDTVASTSTGSAKVTLPVPDTIVSSPTPPTRTVDLPDLDQAPQTYSEVDGGLGSATWSQSSAGTSGTSGTPYTKRASGPFDLGTPQYSPEIIQVDSGYFESQQQQDQQEQQPQEQHYGIEPEEDQTRVRSSVLSTASSEALGGIGGFMMGVRDDMMDASGVEELADSPPIISQPTLQTANVPSAASASLASPVAKLDNLQPHTPVPPFQNGLTEPVSPTSSRGGRPESSDSWDIYGDYARESMYYKRSTRDIKAMSGMDQAFNLAKALADIPSPPPPSKLTQASSTTPGPPVELDSLSPTSRSRPRPSPMPLDLNLASPELQGFREVDKHVRSPVEAAEMGSGRSVATALRMRIQKEREQEQANGNGNGPRAVELGDEEERELAFAPAPPVIPPKSSSRLTAAIAESDKPITESSSSTRSSETDVVESVPAFTPPTLFVTNAEESEDGSQNGDAVDVGNDSQVTEVSAVSDSEQSTIIETPVGPSTDEAAELTQEDIVDEMSVQLEEKPKRNSPSPPLLGSPIPLDEPASTFTALDHPFKVQTPQPNDSPDLLAGPPPRRPSASASNSASPSLRQNLSPDLSLPGSPFSPGSPASPHSVTATRQAAAEIARSASTPVQERNRITTLLGRTDDLLGSKGPVPITFHMGSPGGFRSTGPAAMPSASKEITHGLGLGLPSGNSSRGRISPSGTPGPRRATSPLITSPLIDQPLSGLDDSRFPRSPVTSRNVSSPVQTYTSTPAMPPLPPTGSKDDTSTTTSKSAKSSPSTGSGSGFFPRARSRSFGATVAKAMGRGKKEKVPLPPLAINTALSPKSANVPLPSPANKASSTKQDKKALAQHAAAVPPSPRVNDSPAQSPVLPPIIPLSKTLTAQSTDSLSLPHSHPSPRSATASTTQLPRTPGPTSSSSKTPRKASKALPSPVSHRDYAEETVKADGLDFELVQPTSKVTLLLSPGSPSSNSHESPQLEGGGGSPRPGMMNRSETFKSELSIASARSLPLPDTDEWGFIKDQSPTPEMFQSRSTASDHRAAEHKWLSAISTPLPPGTAIPKKIRKLALESGIPASLRGKVWGWMMVAGGSKRTPGLYTELSNTPVDFDPSIESAITSVFSDHSVFAGPYSTGTADLRSILSAYSRHHPSTPLSSHIPLIAGMLLIHCVAEDAFWLLDGLLGNGGVMSEYVGDGDGAKGVQVDAAVFTGLLAGSEKVMSKKFKEMDLHPRTFLEKWYRGLFIRSLPWPTALRVIDTLIAEGPRFLLIASLSILTLSRERIMDLSSKEDILAYLSDLPQDALLLPEHFLKACAEVKFREEDYRRLRVGVEKELGL